MSKGAAQEFEQAFFAGLQALDDSSFPKRCANCGREYASQQDFLLQTQQVRDDCTGLKEGWDEQDRTVVEVFRNCLCGSTLMTFCGDRRDFSPQGMERRRRFDALLKMLEQKGVQPEQGRQLLLSAMRGQRAELLQKLGLTPLSTPASGALPDNLSD